MSVWVYDGVKMQTMTFVVEFFFFFPSFDSIVLDACVCMRIYVDECVYYYKAKSIDDDGSGGFLYCLTERIDEREKKKKKKKSKEIKEEFDQQRQTSSLSEDGFLPNSSN